MSSSIHPSPRKGRDGREEVKEDLPADSNHDPNNNEGTSTTKTTETDHGTVAVENTPQAGTATAAATTTITTKTNNQNNNNNEMKNGKDNRKGPPPALLLIPRPLSEIEEIQPTPFRLELDELEKYASPKSKQPKERKRGTPLKNADKYPWGMYTTPEGIDLKSEEVKKKPLLADWLGPVLRMEAETAWPRIPKNKEKMQQKETSSTTEEEQPNESADKQENVTDSNNTDGKVPAKPKADENDEQNEGSEDDDDNDGVEDMPDGIADLDRMKAKVAPVFYEGRQFCNIFQAKQMADYVFGRWGVRLKLQKSYHISCSYGHGKYEGKHKNQQCEEIDLKPITPGGDGGDQNKTAANDGTSQNYVDGKGERIVVINTKKRIRREARLKEVGCEFCISLDSQYTATSVKKNEMSRVENPVRITSCNMGHNHECSATTYDYAVHRAGLAGRPTGPNNMRPAIEPKRRVEPNVAAIAAAVESDYENNSAGEMDGSPRPTKKWKPIEQSTIPWGQYYDRSHIFQILRNNPKLKPQDMNWLCPALIEEAEKAWPLPGDISPDLVSDHDRLYEKITAVFYPGRQFCNLFQAQQMADYILGRWGARVKQALGNSLGCCYGHPTPRTKRKWDSGVPFKRNKSNPAIAATFCPWRMNFSYRYPHHRGGKRTGVLRVENPVRITVCDMTHNHPCSAESLRAVKQSAGAYTQKLKRSTWKEIMELLNDDEEVDQNAVLRDILRPYFPDAVPITSSMMFNVRNKAKSMLEKGEVNSDDEGESTEGLPADAFPDPPSYQHLDMSVSLEDHFTYCKGFKNNVKTDENPHGQLEWFCPPDSWLEQESRGVVAREDRSYIDSESGALIIFPTADRSFWRKTHFRPALIKDDGAFLYANLKSNSSYVVEASFSLVAAYDSDEAGLMIRFDSEHWIKAGVQFSNGKVCLYTVVTNMYSDWCPYSVSWPFVFDTRRQEESQVVRSNCTLRIHYRGDDFVIEVQRDDDGDVWDVVRLAHLSRPQNHQNPTKATTTIAAASGTPENEGENSASMTAAPDEQHFWAGVFACCPHEQRGGHAIFTSFRVMQGSSYDVDM